MQENSIFINDCKGEGAEHKDEQCEEKVGKKSDHYKCEALNNTPQNSAQR